MKMANDDSNNKNADINDDDNSDDDNNNDDDGNDAASDATAGLTQSFPLLRLCFTGSKKKKKEGVTGQKSMWVSSEQDQHNKRIGLSTEPVTKVCYQVIIGHCNCDSSSCELTLFDLSEPGDIEN